MVHYLRTLIFVFLALETQVSGNVVKRVDVQMADCKNCGLGILSKVTLKVKIIQIRIDET
jgi:hypothetical protein